MRSVWALTMLVAAFAAGATGCSPSFGPQARNGITFFCPGAGNILSGEDSIREGLREAGYAGQVASVMWTFSFNPAIDQTLRINAHLGASRLSEAIKEYQDQFPGRPVNVIGLSAGTGVAIWAVENLPKGHSVDNVVLLSSSLSHDYDLGEALQHVKGKVYNYYSSEDPILAGPMKVFGTIDGQFFVDGAGAVGLRSPRGSDRIVNIPWRSEFTRLGYYGGHTDVTSHAFVRAQIAQHITGSRTASSERAATTPRPRATRAELMD
jgi:hypothetical protein